MYKLKRIYVNKQFFIQLKDLCDLYTEIKILYPSHDFIHTTQELLVHNMSPTFAKPLAAFYQSVQNIILSLIYRYSISYHSTL